MGMSIDEARTELISGNLFTNKFAKALVVAIDTMHKYRKIQEIIKAHDNDKMPEDYWYIDKIREVVENENVDN